MKKIICLLFLTCSFSLFAITNVDEETKGSETAATSLISQEAYETAITIASQYPDYPATPGDIYNITFLTGANKTQDLTGYVDREYNIDLSFIGKVNVKGLIYSDVQQILKDTILSAYPGSIVNVIIASPGKFSVTLIGEVETAEILDAYSITTLSQVILDKTTKYASFRDIEVRSEDGTTSVYDLFQFTRYANKKQNPYLKPNDVITIRPYKKSVTVVGEVKRPGVYQLLEGETLYDLINIQSEGFTKVADKTLVEIQSIIGSEDTFTEDTQYLNCETRDMSLVQLSDFDKITVKSKLKQMSRVIVQGAITPLEFSTNDGSDQGTPVDTELGSTLSNKIEVPIVSGSRVSTVLSEMKGTFSLTSNLEDAFILRGKDKIDVNLMMLNMPNDKNDIIMMDKDILVIPFKQQIVYVAGSVNDSGAKPFIPNRTADYYIGLAGGADRSENLFGSYVIRDVYGNKRSRKSIIEPEDVIWVIRNHPMSYVTEYAGWATTILSLVYLGYQVDDYLNP